MAHSQGGSLLKRVEDLEARIKALEQNSGHGRDLLSSKLESLERERVIDLIMIETEVIGATSFRSPKVKSVLTRRAQRRAGVYVATACLAGKELSLQGFRDFLGDEFWGDWRDNPLSPTALEIIQCINQIPPQEVETQDCLPFYPT